MRSPAHDRDRPAVEVLLPPGLARGEERVGAVLPGRAARLRNAALPQRATALEPGFDGLPRALAEATADRLAALDGRFFARWIDGHDLRASFVYVLSLELGMRFLPELHAFLGSAEPGAEAALLEAQLHADETAVAAERLGHSTGPITCLTDLARSERVLAGLEREADAGGERIDLRPVGAILLCGTEPEVARLGELVDAIAPAGGSMVIAKAGGADCSRAVAALIDRGARGALPASSLLGLPPDPAAADVYRSALRDLRGLLAALEPGDRGFFAKHAATVARRARLALGWSRLVRATEPRLVAGTLDRSAWGPLAAEHPEDRAYALVEVQHGLNVSYGARDLLEFDLVLAFNERSRRALLAEGYAAERPVAIVGDPRWERLRANTAGRGVDDPLELRPWKGADPLMVVFSQPRKGPLMSAGAIAALYEWVAAAARRTGARVLVRRRHGEPADPEERALDDLVAAGRARLVAGDESDIEEVLAPADAAVSVFSSALLEARVAGVPCVSPDPDGVLRFVGLDDVAVGCRDAESFAAAVEAALVADAVQPGDGILPVFETTYPERVRAALRDLGVLPPG